MFTLVRICLKSVFEVSLLGDAAIGLEYLGDTQWAAKISVVAKFRFSQGTSAFAPDLLHDFHGNNKNATCLRQ